MHKQASSHRLLCELVDDVAYPLFSSSPCMDFLAALNRHTALSGDRGSENLSKETLTRCTFGGSRY